MINVLDRLSCFACAGAGDAISKVSLYVQMISPYQLLLLQLLCELVVVETVAAKTEDPQRGSTTNLILPVYC
jgi:hypothetical protein